VVDAAPATAASYDAAVPLPLASSLDVVLLGVLGAVGLLFLLAHFTRIPYPIWLTVGGATLGFVPGVPAVELEPELVLVLFLPPLLTSAAYYSSIRDLRFNARPIALLSIGLVLVTTLAVAAVAHLVVGMPWEVAFVLGAVLGPTDPVAATAIAGRVGAPRRVVTVLEGESLVNDATALIAFRFAVAAVVTGTFSLVDAVGDFALGIAGGVAIGLAIGVVSVELLRRIDDPPTEAVLTLLMPYFAYLPAEALGLSAVVAAVTAGIYSAMRAPRIFTPTSRLQLNALVIFLLNGALFVLVGLQLPELLDALDGFGPGEVALYAAVVIATVIAVRFAWVFPATYLPRALSRRVRENDPWPGWQGPFAIAFTGMRGAVSLAAALSIPETIEGGGEFPFRDLIIFLTFATIVFTVCVEGLTLPALLRGLGLGADEAELREEDKARLLAAEGALRRIEQLREEEWVRDDTAERLSGLYRFRQRRFRARLGKEPVDDGLSLPLDEDTDSRSRDYQRLLREILEAQRDTLIDLRREGRISDDAMRRIERDLDLEDARLDYER
jgi:CPA1 family monovalent cation:H+ antiporter